MHPCPSLGRFWMVTKKDGHMVTARQEPRLVLVSVTCEDDSLIFRAPGVDQLILPSKMPSSHTVHDCRYLASGPRDLWAGFPWAPPCVLSAQPVMRPIKETCPGCRVRVGLEPGVGCEL